MSTAKVASIRRNSWKCVPSDAVRRTLVEAIWAPMLGALIGATLGVLANWIDKPQWAKDRPGALIALIVGLAVVGALIGVGADKSTDNDNRGNGGDGPSTSPPPSTTSGKTSSSQNPQWVQAWTGSVSLPNNRFLELDSTPPHSIQGEGSNAELLYSNMEAKGMRLYPAMDFSEVSEQGSSDPTACDESILTSPVDAMPPEDGQVFCMRTTEDNLARLTVQSSAYEVVVFQVIVWRRG
jgi:hypothetical protein